MTRPSGRPQSIEPEAVARIALDLFDQHGYGEVSMAQIAEAAGIGRKSLYRYFPSKTDLVWGGLLEASAISEQSLESAQEPALSLRKTMYAATEAALKSLPDLELTRGRLRLIAERDELLSQAPIRMQIQNENIQHFLINNGVAAESAHYLATAFGAVTFAAWIRWAQSSDPSPAPHLAEAMRTLNLPADDS